LLKPVLPRVQQFERLLFERFLEPAEPGPLRYVEDLVDPAAGAP
jgi:hypothetical protein